jgi:hypothetical protein
METIQMENLKTNSKKATKKISLFSREHPRDLISAYIGGDDRVSRETKLGKLAHSKTPD